MNSFLNSLCSTVGKKYALAISGVFLILFVVFHLLGNLSLYLASGDVFNQYAHAMVSLGWLFTVGEIGIFSLIGAHFVLTTYVTIQNRRARPERYAQWSSKGTIEYSNRASRSMILTGIFLGAFIVFHVLDFRFGEHFTTQVNGVEMRDLHRLVTEEFKETSHVVIYVLAMGLLFFHLRHGFWSCFQSLGAVFPRYSSALYCLGWFLALLISLGFMGIPLWIYFGGPEWLAR